MIQIETTTRDGQIEADVILKGGTNELIDELAFGVAQAIVMMADDMPALDDLHESLARLVCGQALAIVAKTMLDRDGQAEDGQGDA